MPQVVHRPIVRRVGAASRSLLSAQWARLGGGFAVEPSAHRVDLERLLVESAGAAPNDARLFAVTTSWLAVHGKFVNVRRLGRLLEALPRGESPDEQLAVAVFGAMVQVTIALAPAMAFLRAAQSHCRPLSAPRPLFERFMENSALTQMAREECLPAFSAWGLWHNTITDKRDAVRPVSWLLRACPELHMRSLFGADLAADIMEEVRSQPATIADLVRTTGATAPAVHETVGNLLARGLVDRPGTGYRKPVRVAPATARLLMRTMLGPMIAPAKH